MSNIIERDSETATLVERTLVSEQETLATKLATQLFHKPESAISFWYIKFQISKRDYEKFSIVRQFAQEYYLGKPLNDSFAFPIGDAVRQKLKETGKQTFLNRLDIEVEDSYVAAKWSWRKFKFEHFFCNAISN